MKIFWQIQDAVLYNLIIISEAVIIIDRALLDKYLYPWYKVRHLRNYAAHEYFNIKLWTIWDVANQHVDTLQDLIEVMLEKEF